MMASSTPVDKTLEFVQSLNWSSSKNQTHLGVQLLPTIVRSVDGTVLGLAYSSKESLKEAIELGSGIYWSRSRNGLWVKSPSRVDGQILLNVAPDCDRDSLIFTVRQYGEFCHNHTLSCFEAPLQVKKIPRLTIGFTYGHGLDYVMKFFKRVGINVAQDCGTRVKMYTAMSVLHPDIVLLPCKPRDIDQMMNNGVIDVAVCFSDCLGFYSSSRSALMMRANPSSTNLSITKSLYEVDAPKVEIVAAVRKGSTFALSHSLGELSSEEEDADEDDYGDAPFSMADMEYLLHHAVSSVSAEEFAEFVPLRPSKPITLFSEYAEWTHVLQKMYKIDKVVVVHGNTERFVQDGIADAGVMVKNTGASLEDHGLEVLTVLETPKLGMHFGFEAYSKFPRFFREIANQLDTSTILFYSVDGSHGYMSNFFPAKFVDSEGRSWLTSEHYYQAHKFICDPVVFELVRSQDTAKKCYKIAYEHQDRFPANWSEVKDAVMWKALKYKFDQNPLLMFKLRDTGSKLLVEHALKDFHHGCGLDNTGKNHLGLMLMAIRDGEGSWNPTIPTQK